MKQAAPWFIGWAGAGSWPRASLCWQEDAWQLEGAQVGAGLCFQRFSAYGLHCEVMMMSSAGEDTLMQWTQEHVGILPTEELCLCLAPATLGQTDLGDQSLHQQSREKPEAWSGRRSRAEPERVRKGGERRGMMKG